MSVETALRSDIALCEPPSRRGPRARDGPKAINSKERKAMKLSDAANLLQLSGAIDAAIIKAAYRKAAFIFHPDRNPSGLEMMKMINEAFQVLKGYEGNITVDEGVDKSGFGYPEAVSDALDMIIELSGIEIEVCGAWVWVSGDSYPHRKELKKAGFIFAGKKKMWYYRPDDWESKARGRFSMDDIRDRYGSSTPAKSERKKLTTA